MAEITLESLTKVYPDGTQRRHRPRPRGGERRVRRLRRPVGLRQDDGAADDRRARDDHLRARADRRPRRQRPAAEGPRHRDGLPELRALPAHERGQEHGLRAQDARAPARRDRPPGRRGGARSSASRTSLHKKPRTLSGGQRQRVAMGRAIVRNPQAFLMDEPLSNLDAKLRVEMRAEIARIQRDLGVTTIYVTHDQTEAMTHGRPRRRDAERRPPAGRRPEGALRPAAQPVRRRVHRLAGDEPRRWPTSSGADGDLSVSFGPHRLRLDPATLEKHPGLSAYDGRSVVLGIRPEDMEDAAVLRETRSRPAPAPVVCDIREDMGSEVYVHFNVAAEPLTTPEVVEALVGRGRRGRGGPPRRGARARRGRRVRRATRPDDGGARAAAARGRRSTSRGSTSSIPGPVRGSPRASTRKVSAR